MILKWFGPLALLAALFLGDQIRINRPGHKYRLIVEVVTPEGRKSAASVLALLFFTAPGFTLGVAFVMSALFETSGLRSDVVCV